MQEDALQWLVAQFMQRLWGKNYHMRALFHLELASGHHTAHVDSYYIRWFLLKLALGQHPDTNMGHELSQRRKRFYGFAFAVTSGAVEPTLVSIWAHSSSFVELNRISLSIKRILHKFTPNPYIVI